MEHIKYIDKDTNELIFEQHNATDVPNGGIITHSSGQWNITQVLVKAQWTECICKKV